MKILCITPYFPYPPQSGGMSCIWEKIKIFKRMEYEIDLFSVTNKNIDDSNLRDVKRYVKNVNCIKRQSGSCLIFKAIKVIVKKDSLFLSLIRLEYRDLIASMLDKNDYDAVLCEHTYMGYWFMKEFPQYVSKTVTTVHNIEYDWYKYMALKEKNFFRKLYYFIEMRAFEKKENSLFSSESKFLFLSKNEMKKVNDNYKNENKCRLISGIPLEKKCNFMDAKDRENIITFVARMDSERNRIGIKYFIENIYPIILNQCKNVELRIVGRGDDGSFSHYLLNSKNRNSIQFVGEVDFLDIEYKKAKIIIIPILESIGIQTKLFEAINYNSIVVATSHAVLGTVFDSGKGVIIQDDTKEFADACSKILNNEFNFDEKYSEINQLYNTHGYESYRKNMNDFLREIIN